jgi:hypothetical protein
MTEIVADIPIFRAQTNTGGVGMGKRFIIALLAVCLIGGSSRYPSTVRQRFVSRIVITCENQEKTYTSQGKMIQILNGLRQLGQKTLAQMDPDTLSVPFYQIILERSDGSSITYRIRGERYIRRNHDPWMQTDPQALSDLVTLLQSLPADG